MTSLIKIPLELNSKTYWLSPYNSRVEKDILIMLSFEVYDPDKYLEIFGIDSKDLSDNEKRALLWKIREISLGNEVNIHYTCDNCRHPQDHVLVISNFIINGERNDHEIKKLNIEVNDDTLSKFVDLSQDEIDNLPIKEYENLLKKVKLNQIKYDFRRSCSCMSCGAEKTFDMSNFEYILDSLSDENLASMYRVYSHLIYYGNYSKEDIDSMYPFERTIFIGLLHSIKTEKK